MFLHLSKHLFCSLSAAGQIAVKLTVDIHGPLRTLPNVTSDSLVMMFPTSRYFHLPT